MVRVTHCLLAAERNSVILCKFPGKTALARWLTRQVDNDNSGSGGLCRVVEISCADLIHKVVGEAERRITDVFREGIFIIELNQKTSFACQIFFYIFFFSFAFPARRRAPCFIILDNLDIIIGSTGGGGGGGLRSRTSHAATDRLLSVLLVEIDGLESRHHNQSRGFVTVIATATNADSLDRY